MMPIATLSANDVNRMTMDEMKRMAIDLCYVPSADAQFMSRAMLVDCVATRSNPFIFHGKDADAERRYTYRESGLYIGKPSDWVSRHAITEEYQLAADVFEHVFKRPLPGQPVIVTKQEEQKQEEAPKSEEATPTQAQSSTTAPKQDDKLGQIAQILGLSGGVSEERVREIIEETNNRTLVIKIADRPLVDLGEEAVHASFEKALFYLSCNLPTYLWGPSGSGKSTMAKQLAKALNAKHFASICCSAETSSTEMFGRPMLHNGGFAESPILQAFEQDYGFLFIDEADRLMDVVATALNSGLANGYIPVPMRHEKPAAYAGQGLWWLLAGNTDMSGNSSQFSASKQDAAFANRMRTQMVHVDYDKLLELRIAEANGCKWIASAIQDARDLIKKYRIDDELGTRQVTALCVQSRNGADKHRIVASVLAKYSAEEAAKIKPAFDKYL